MSAFDGIAFQNQLPGGGVTEGPAQLHALLPLEAALRLTREQWAAVSGPDAERLWGVAQRLEEQLYRNGGPVEWRHELMKVVERASRRASEWRESIGDLPF